MSDESGVCIYLEELDELFVLLSAQESQLHPTLIDLKRRLEKELYQRYSIETMEKLIRRAGDDLD